MFRLSEEADQLTGQLQENKDLNKTLQLELGMYEHIHNESTGKSHDQQVALALIYFSSNVQVFPGESILGKMNLGILLQVICVYLM